MIILLVTLVICIMSGIYLRNPKNGESVEDLESILYVNEPEDSEPKEEEKTEDDSESEVMEDLDTEEVDSKYEEECKKDAFDILKEVNDEK